MSASVQEAIARALWAFHYGYDWDNPDDGITDPALATTPEEWDEIRSEYLALAAVAMDAVRAAVEALPFYDNGGNYDDGWNQAWGQIRTLLAPTGEEQR